MALPNRYNIGIGVMWSMMLFCVIGMLISFGLAVGLISLLLFIGLLGFIFLIGFIIAWIFLE